MQKLAGTWFDSKFEIKRVLRFLFLFFFWVVLVFLWDLLFYIIYFYTCALMGSKTIYHTINFSRMLFSCVLEYIDCT